MTAVISLQHQLINSSHYCSFYSFQIHHLLMRSGLRGKMRQIFSLYLSANVQLRDQDQQICWKNVAVKGVIWRRFKNIVNGGEK